MNVAVRPQPLDILSICTGGGGLDLGIELAIPGARSVCMVEREAFAVAHLVAAMEQGLMAPAPVWSDAGTFDGRRWRGCVDGLIGGIPCQPHSLAGRKQGQLDHRDLWSDARRIIVQSRAWFVLIENVGGMLSAGADEIAGAERVWRDLRKLGFAVEIGLFTAAEVGASHERERVFILGCLDHAPGERERRIAGELAGATHAHVTGQQAGRDRHAHVAGEGFPSVGLAAADSERLEGQRPDAGAQGRPDAGRPAGLRSRADLGSSEVAYASGDGQFRSEESDFRAIQSGQPTPRRRDAERCDRALGDANTSAPQIRKGDAPVCRGRAELSAGVRAASGSADELALGHAICGGHDWRSDDALGHPIERTAIEGAIGYPLFPPPPDALSSWAGVLASAPELEPAFRRVADGLASRLDVGRVDRLRMLGNGVVPLQAAHAFRTLCHRLAGRGSAGAARLVRMMGEML